MFGQVKRLMGQMKTEDVVRTSDTCPDMRRDQDTDGAYGEGGGDRSTPQGAAGV